MKAIIPAKDSSTRVPHKNFKPFYKDMSLFDITVNKLLKSISPSNIYMSCENEERKNFADKWGINFLFRDPVLASNDTPMYDVFNGICEQIPGNDDIAWCQVIDPLFDSYEECFNIWGSLKESGSTHDSLVAVYPEKDYYLDENYNPKGFGFGAWHKISQLLPTTYRLTFTFSILTRDCIKKCGYYVGSNPFWYHALNKSTDIDTEEDFDFTSKIYQLIKR